MGFILKCKVAASTIVTNNKSTKFEFKIFIIPVSSIKFESGNALLVNNKSASNNNKEIDVKMYIKALKHAHNISVFCFHALKLPA